MVGPLYVCEISPKDSRGMLVSFFGVLYGLGILLAACANIGFSQFLPGWRVTLSILAFSVLLYAVGTLWLPHTPRYVLIKWERYSIHDQQSDE